MRLLGFRIVSIPWISFFESWLVLQFVGTVLATLIELVRIGVARRARPDGSGLVREKSALSNPKTGQWSGSQSDKGW
jgi:hypothetical protein